MSDNKDKEQNKLSFLKKIVDKFIVFYEPSNTACFDEIIAPFQGRFKYLSYNPQKPERWGIKLYSFCDSRTGYCLSLFPSVQAEKKKLNDIIIQSYNKIREKGIKFLFFDNYFTNLELTDKFLKLGIGLTGTFRSNRIPKDIRKSIKTTKIKKNEI